MDVMYLSLSLFRGHILGQLYRAAKFPYRVHPPTNLSESSADPEVGVEHVETFPKMDFFPHIFGASISEKHHTTEPEG